MRVVITGASGNIGTALLRALGSGDHDVVAIARRQPPPVEPYSRARWLCCDIGGPGAQAVVAEACRGADAVIHLAWAISPRTAEAPMWRTNRVGTRNVLTAVASTGVRQLICASSVAAYRPAPRWQRVDEDWPLTGVPGSAYSADKAAMEAQVDEFAEQHPAIRVARIRPSGVLHGEAAAELADWALARWLPRAPLRRRWLPVPVWPSFRLQAVHSEDVAAALVLILRQRSTGAFNLAAEPVLPAPELVHAFGGIRLTVPRPALMAGAWAGWRLGIQPLHPGWLRLADRACLVDSTRARRELGWEPVHSAVETLTELAAGIADRRAGNSAPLAPAPPPIRLGHPTHQSQAPNPSAPTP